MEEKPMGVYVDVDGKKFDVSTWGGFRDASEEIKKVYRHKIEVATYHRNTAIDKTSAEKKFEKAVAEAVEWQSQKSREIIKLATY